MNDLTFQQAIKDTEDVIKRFEKIEEKPWKAEGTMIELMKQVGELSKFIMVYEKYYFPNREKDDTQYLATKDKIGDELADIFFAIVRLAQHYDISLEQAHIDARKSENEYLDSKNA